MTVPPGRPARSSARQKKVKKKHFCLQNFVAFININDCINRMSLNCYLFISQLITIFFFGQLSVNYCFLRQISVNYANPMGTLKEG